MKTLARPALRSAATSISTMAGVRIRALTERHPIKPTSPRCHSAWQLNLGRHSTYRRGKSVQTTGTTSDEHRETLHLVRRRPALDRSPRSGKTKLDRHRFFRRWTTISCRRLWRLYLPVHRRRLDLVCFKVNWSTGLELYSRLRRWHAPCRSGYRYLHLIRRR